MHLYFLMCIHIDAGYKEEFVDLIYFGTVVLVCFFVVNCHIQFIPKHLPGVALIVLHGLAQLLLILLSASGLSSYR